MDFHYTKRNYNTFYLIIFVFIGLVFNICINLLVTKVGIPMYFDTIGTIFLAFIGGALPAIITGLLTNVFLNIFVPGYLYFSVINVIIALLASWFFNFCKGRKALRLFYFILVSAVVCSVIGMGIQYVISGLPMEAGVEEVSQLIYKGEGDGYIFVLMFVSFFLNLVDKAVSVLLAYLFYTLVPENLRKDVSNYGWRQKPLTIEEIKAARSTNGNRTIHKNVSFILSTTIILLSIILIWISISFYYDDCKEEYTEEAFAVVESAASIIDGDDINEYVKWGKQAAGYQDVQKSLKMLLNNTQGVVKLSVFIPEHNGYLFLFQEAKPDVPISENGVILPYQEDLYPYAENFRRKEVVDDILFSKDRSVMTATYPIRNSDGEIISYVAADVYMSFLSEYARDYLIKTFLCFSGFIIMIMVFGFTQVGYDLVIPINSITKAASEFLDSHGDQKALDENVRKTRSIAIRTGDEVEQLYVALCKMESEMAEYVRDLRHYADNNKKTQNSLIITLAGIVESRDSDSNAHVRNTAVYVRIILNGLKRKGYYPEKISDEYIEELEMSAPLHDIGKIHIPDAILNKRGKLTKEEEDIYRSHTVYGRVIMDKAISTVKGDSYLKEARNMAAYHHERWDGKGYPEGLHGEVIPLSARVMALANTLDDLTAPRKFKMTYTLEEAIEIIKDESGKHFDPKCVEALLECINEVKVVIKNNSLRRY